MKGNKIFPSRGCLLIFFITGLIGRRASAGGTASAVSAGGGAE
jgi:hypothetical protein